VSQECHVRVGEFDKKEIINAAQQEYRVN